MRLLDTTRGRSVLHIGWNGLRKEHLKQEPFCMACGFAPKKGYSGLDVHHIFPRHLFPDVARDPDNLITLCRRYDCHLRVGHFGNYSKFWNPKVRFELLVIACGAAGSVGGNIRKAEQVFKTKGFKFVKVDEDDK